MALRFRDFAAGTRRGGGVRGVMGEKGGAGGVMGEKGGAASSLARARARRSIPALAAAVLTPSARTSGTDTGEWTSRPGSMPMEERARTSRGAKWISR